MTQINIPFSEDMTGLVCSGKKTATSRNKQYGTIGDTFQVDNMLFKITNIEYLSLLNIASYYFKKEGFKKPQEFIDVWKSLHQATSFEPTKKVYFHTFKRIN